MDELVEYEATQRDDGKYYNLQVTCPSPLSQEEFAHSLIEFANRILEGTFDFDSPDTSDATILQ